MSKKVSDEIKKYVFELNAQGLKASEIAKIVGLNRTTILNYVRPENRNICRFVTKESLDNMSKKLNYFLNIINNVNVGNSILFKSRGYSFYDRKYVEVYGIIYQKFEDKIFVKNINVIYCITINDLMGRNVIIVKVGDGND